MRLHADAGASTMLVAFGGIRGGFGIPLFEFSTLTESMPAKRLFVRDLRQAWYHRGLTRRSKTLLESVDVVREIVASEAPERLVMTGNSAGGYAALVFGTLLGADLVLAFSPQTVLAPEQLAQLGDHRWDAYLRPLASAGRLDRRWTDLREALPAHRHADTRYEIYFGSSDRADRIHAENLAGIAGVHHHAIPETQHFVVRKMRKHGTLEQVLRRALEQAPAADDREPPALQAADRSA
jgi:acetyl esterase/lipase